jgi:hypothetical protein
VQSRDQAAIKLAEMTQSRLLTAQAYQKWLPDKKRYEEELEILGQGRKIESFSAEEIDKMASHTLTNHLENDLYRTFLEMNREK